MSGATAIAITGIVVSGVVGPSLGAWWSRQRQRRDISQQRHSALAEVLDDSAKSLGIARQAFERVHVLESGGVSPTTEEATEAARQWRAALTDVRYSRDRLAIRIGERHPVHVAFVACVDNLERRRALAWSYEKGVDTAKARVVEEQAHHAFKDVRTAYLDACKELLQQDA